MKYQTQEKENFDMVSLKLASPERIREWSCGEVTKPETINYRTQKSERGGLFDERIFGPDKDYECYCGKYRGIRYKGIVCEKCGVELTRSIVRRERMGHIELAVPVAHIWFLKGIPSRISSLLGLNSQELEKVVYFAGYIVTSVSEEERNKVLRELDSEYKSKIKNLQDDKSKEKLKELFQNARREIESLKPLLIMDEASYSKFSMKYGTIFEAGIGAEVVHDILKKIDLRKMENELEKALESAGAAEREKLGKRLSLVRSLLLSGVRPEWMFVTVLPVIPPALRPIVALEGGRHATSDANDLYRRVINRNNRLKKLQEIKAPDVILRNEKRILQEAADALIDNSIRHSGGLYSAMSQAQRRPLKSLSDTLKGKQGIFRQNLLGKRVDYSGRSVIVVGPNLKLNQCGLPKRMALELFRPFVISKLLSNELAHNIRGAGRLIDEEVPEVWAMLEEVIEGKYVLLNRAPTLHRLGIQAFKPVLIEGNAIQIHPLVCSAFNADFDGDQMAVHVPLSDEAQFEAREIMASDKNLLKPGDGRPVISSKMLDIVLGTYWMTSTPGAEKGDGKIFSSPNSAITASDFDEVSYRANIKVLGTDSPKYAEFGGEPFETSVGRLLFNSVLPKDYPYINKVVDSKVISSLVDALIEKYGFDLAAAIVDRIKDFGFRYATYSGVTWGVDDIKVPEEKHVLTAAAKAEVEEIESQFNEGLLSREERYRKSVEVWHKLRSQVEKVIADTLDKTGSVYYMWKSGARGSLGSITNMAGMKGLIATTSGEAREQPVLTSGKEGYSPIEYFITTHGSRKGLADTALNTAKAGYLTRRLFDVAQDVVVVEEDCGSKEGFVVERGEGAPGSFARNIAGRYLMSDVHDGQGAPIFKKGHLLSHVDSEAAEKEAAVKSVSVRSPLSCKSSVGVCQKCYGVDPSKNKLVELGTAVGTVAAQAIGEPATQLTMRTFHAGGTASVGGDITAGLPRVEEIFERRSPKNSAVVCRFAGMVTDVMEDGRDKKIVVQPELSEKSKTKKTAVEYPVNWRRTVLVKKGDEVKKGEIMTDGSADLSELLKFAGRERTQNYIIHEVNKIYELQAASISKKHIETIVKQMFSRVRVKDAGDTSLVAGEVVSGAEIKAANEKAAQIGGAEAKAEDLVMGITEVSLSRKSFLSAASFQYTTRVLITSALRGSKDKLKGLKENVILGRLIPAGTGFPGNENAKKIEEMQKEREKLYYGEEE